MEYRGGILVVNSDLYHHGILGQKWGKRNGPPYPLDGPDHSSSEKKAGWKKSLGGGGSFKRKKKKNLDAKAIAQERLKTLQKENPALYDAKKQTALQKGNSTEVLQFKGNLTNQQLQDAVNRIRLEKQLSDWSTADVKSNWDKVDDAMKRVKQVTDWTNISLNAYDAAEKVYKKLSDTK